MKVVKLTNGSEEALAHVITVTLSLKSLASDGIAGYTKLYDLREVCRDGSYWNRVSSTNRNALQTLSLVDSHGQVHDSIRNIVLSSVDGEGADMALVNPVTQ